MDIYSCLDFYHTWSFTKESYSFRQYTQRIFTHLMVTEWCLHGERWGSTTFQPEIALTDNLGWLSWGFPKPFGKRLHL